MNRDQPKPAASPGVDDDGLDLPDDRSAPVKNNVTGRVKFDERGNAVWEWALSTGSFGTDVTHARMKKLEDRALAITDEEAAGSLPPAAGAPKAAPVAPAPAPVKENRKGVTQGYSPYDSGLLVKSEAARAKKKDLRRLSEWLKLREQYKRNNPEGS